MPNKRFILNPLLQSQLSVAYLGGQFSFHHLVVLRIFKNAPRLLPQNSFDAIINQVQNGSAKYGVIAISNSLAGLVEGNLKRIANSGLEIESHFFLKISLHLAALKGTTLPQIKKVYSQAMAIKQSQQFFKEWPQIELFETSSTAQGILQIAQQKDMDCAAIGNKEAIDFYKLQIIAPHIGDEIENYTRFFLICKPQKKPQLTTRTPIIASLIITCAANLTLSKELLAKANTHHFSILLIEPIELQKSDTQYYIEIEFSSILSLELILGILRLEFPKLLSLGIFKRGAKRIAI